MENILKKISGIFAIIVMISLMIFLPIYLFNLIVYAPNHEAVYGNPIIILLIGVFVAFFVVITLEVSAGKIEFSGLGFSFKGASGPIVLWIAVFVAIEASYLAYLKIP